MNIEIKKSKNIKTDYCFCIPVRYDSSRLPQKPFLKFGDKTMIQRTYEQVIKSKYFDKTNVFIVTEDDIIKDKVVEFGKVLFGQKSTNIYNGTDAIINILDKLPEQYKYIVNVQGDEPFLESEHIDYIVDCFNKEDVASAVEWLKQEDDKLFVWLMEQPMVRGFLPVIIELGIRWNKNRNLAFADVVRGEK